MVNNIQSTQTNAVSDISVKKLETASASTKQKQSSNSEQYEGRYDTFEKSNSSSEDTTGIYSKEKIAEQLELAEEQRQQAFHNFIQSMVTEQFEESNFTLAGLNLKVTEADSQKALEAISDGGEYSVDAVATRIMDMAEALAGGDQTKLAMLREAVTAGFSDAAKKLGLKDEEMPDITKETYAEVMNRFDAWEQSFKEKEEDSEQE
ncbi:MAG: hypothetical protein ACI4JM_04250 [Oscillospiraceae bacterium]